MREVVRGDKHNLRKSANRNAQISVIHSAHWIDLCFAICRFSQVVFVTSNNFTHSFLFYCNLSPFCNIGSVLAVLRSGMHSLTQWATARSHRLLFVALMFHYGVPRQTSPPPPPETEVWSTMGESIKPSSFYNSTLSADKHALQICRSPLAPTSTQALEYKSSSHSSQRSQRVDAYAWSR